MPSIILGFVLSSLYGLVFYVLMAHGWWRLLFYWVVGVGGFFLGQFIASAVGLNIFNIGETNLIEGTVASWLGLLAVRTWTRQKKT